VVVEEERPPKTAEMKVKRSGVGAKVASPRLIEESEDEEEGELSDEEDTYDIDDSSFEAMDPDGHPTGDDFERREKNSSHRRVMSPKRKSKSRSRSRPRPFATGFDSPGRFASASTHTPTIAPRHVEFNLPRSPSTDSSPPQSDEAQYGARDDIRSPEPSSGNSRIPKDRELDLEPTLHGRPRGHNGGPEHHEHRAFAVWGHDESDSNASDNE